MVKMNKEEIYSIISSIPKGAAGVWAVGTVTEKLALKKSRLTGEPTPARLQKITVVFNGTATLGTDYESMVNATRAREGKAENFEALETYCAPVSENLLIFQHKESEQLYFRMYIDYMATGGVCSYFDANGAEISPKEYSQIKAEYLKAESESKRQGTDKEIKPRNYKAENVVYLKRGQAWLDTRAASEPFQRTA